MKVMPFDSVHEACSAAPIAAALTYCSCGDGLCLFSVSVTSAKRTAAPSGRVLVPQACNSETSAYSTMLQATLDAVEFKIPVSYPFGLLKIEARGWRRDTSFICWGSVKREQNRIIRELPFSLQIFRGQERRREGRLRCGLASRSSCYAV